MATTYDVYSATSLLGLVEININLDGDPNQSTVELSGDNELQAGMTFQIGGTTYTYVGNLIEGGEAIGIVATSGGPVIGQTHVIVPDDTDYSEATLSVSLLSGGSNIDDDTGWFIDEGQPVCFLEGTLIATPQGEVAVETLRIGDLVLTADGRSVPVKWVGEMKVIRRAGLIGKLEPVCIAAGALGEGVPHTDLYVSADHGLIWADMVVNAAAMVNGTTIRNVPLSELPATFRYFHIETEAHDEIVANGAPAETYIDYVSRRLFANYQEYIDLYGCERVIPEMKRLRVSAQRMLPDHLRAQLGIPAFGKEIEAEYSELMEKLSAA